MEHEERVYGIDNVLGTRTEDEDEDMLDAQNDGVHRARPWRTNLVERLVKATPVMSTRRMRARSMASRTMRMMS